MAPLALKSVSAKSACCPQRAAVTVRAPRVVVFAEPRFSLGNNDRTADGYVEKDTAGQSNMYPTVMKPYEAGSSSDTVQQEGANNAVAVGGSVIALGAIGLGLTALVGSGSSPAPADAEDFSQYLSLSAYSAAFEQELVPRRAPAPVAEVVAAPEVTAEVAEAAPAVASE